jgi:hypothetical protein
MVFANDGTISIKSLSGTNTADFTYDRLKGEGSCSIGNREYDFSANGAKINIGDIGVYKRAGSSFDTNEFIDRFGRLGTWYSEDRGEVLVFNNEGELQSKHLNSVNDAEYEYDIERETGSITIEPFTYKFKMDDGQLNIEGMGIFTEAGNGFEADSFFSDFGDSEIGIWYDAAGEGAIDLHADGTYDLVSFGRNIEGTYTQAGSDITITYKYINIDIGIDYTYENGLLKHEDNAKTDIRNFTRNYTELKVKEHFYDEVVGKWVSSTGTMTLMFYNDGTCSIEFPDSFNEGTFKYEPVGNMGYFTITKGYDVLFVVFQDYLTMVDTKFYKVAESV